MSAKASEILELSVEVPKPEAANLSSGESALMVVDMQNDFMHSRGSLYVGQQSMELIENIVNLVNLARRAGVVIVYTKDWHTLDDVEFNIWPRHCVMGSWGAEVVDALKPLKTDFVVTKSTYDPWYETELQNLLKRIGCSVLVVAGAVSNICVLHAVAGAALRGYKIVVPADCVVALSRCDQSFALRQISNVYHGTITASNLIHFE